MGLTENFAYVLLILVALMGVINGKNVGDSDNDRTHELPKQLHFQDEHNRSRIFEDLFGSSQWKLFNLFKNKKTDWEEKYLRCKKWIQSLNANNIALEATNNALNSQITTLTNTVSACQTTIQNINDCIRKAFSDPLNLVKLNGIVYNLNTGQQKTCAEAKAECEEHGFSLADVTNTNFVAIRDYFTGTSPTIPGNTLVKDGSSCKTMTISATTSISNPNAFGAITSTTTTYSSYLCMASEFCSSYITIVNTNTGSAGY